MVDVLGLTRIRDEVGDELYYDASATDTNKPIYIVVDGNTSSTPIQIKDEYGNNPWILSDYSYDGYTSSYKAYAVEQTTDGFVLAIKSEYGYEGSVDTSWTIYDVSSSGVIDYSSYRNSVTNVEVEFNEDLNLDGAIGFSESLLTQKSTDNSGDLLYVDSEEYLYIKAHLKAQDIFRFLIIFH